MCVLVVGAALALAQCGGSATPAPSTRSAHSSVAPTATLSVGRPQQRFEGWGGSVTTELQVDALAGTNGVPSDDVRRVDRLIFRSAGINLLRIYSPAFRFGTFRPEMSTSDGRFQLMRRARRYGVRFLLDGARAGPSAKDGTPLKPGQEAAYAKSLADVLEFASRRVGVPFSYVAVGNEVDNQGGLVPMSPDQARLVYSELARQITSRGLLTTIVLGDNTSWAKSLQYVQQEISGAGVREKTHALASHDYFSTPASRLAFKQFAQGHGLRVWMTEWSKNCSGGKCPAAPPIEFALDRAAAIPPALNEGGASTWFQFRPVSDTIHGVDDGLIVRNLNNRSKLYTRAKRFYALRQFSFVGRPGSRVLQLVRQGQPLPAVGFRYKRRNAVVVVNRQSTVVGLRLDLGRGHGRLRARRTSPSANFAALKAVRYRGRPVIVTLAPKSVTTYYLAPR